MTQGTRDSRTLSDSLYHQLVYEICSGIRRPGEPIREIALSQTHGVSRTPVRLALDRLVEAGFATRNPNQGVRVALSLPKLTSNGLPASPPEVNPTTIRERAYERILEMITRGHLKPGQRLIATRLSEELKVGETPIIFALQMLGQGGMVKKIPRRGYFVQNIDLRRVEQIYDLREYLEGASAALAAKNLTDSGRQALLSLYEQPMDRRMLVEADVQFHKILMENSQNELLQQHLAELLESIRLFHIFGLRVIEARLHEVVAEHRAIISSVINGESDLSETLMRAHIRRSKAHSLHELVEFGLATA